MGVLMRLRFLKPVNGWPGFLTELTIVVLGILIALGAQQTVDGWRWQKEVGEFRAAMDDELGFNLGAYEDRLGQSKCINRRLDQLDQWQRQLTSGAPLQLTSAIRRPTTLSLRTSVWESRTSDVTSHLGLKARLAYAELYDEVNTYIELRVYRAAGVERDARFRRRKPARSSRHGSLARIDRTGSPVRPADRRELAGDH